MTKKENVMTNAKTDDNSPTPISELVFHEMYDRCKLSYIISKKEIFKKYLNENGPPDCERGQAILDQIERYYNSTDLDTGKVPVKYSHKERKFLEISKGERYFANGSVSMQSMCRKIRHSIAEGLYYDLDMVNSYIICLIYICKECGIEAPLLKVYYENRDRIFAEILPYLPTITKDFAKQAVLSMIMGGAATFASLLELMDGEVDIEEHYIFFTKLKDEIRDITDKICNLRDLKSLYTKFAIEKPVNSKGKFLATLMCEVENFVLELIFEKLDRCTDVCLCFDGMLIPVSLVNKLGDKETLITILEAEIQKKLGINVKLIFKALDCSFWSTDGRIKIKELEQDYDEFLKKWPIELKLKKQIFELAQDGYNEHKYGELIMSYVKGDVILSKNGDGFIFNDDKKIWVAHKKDAIANSLIKKFPFVRITEELFNMCKWQAYINPSDKNDILFKIVKSFYNKISNTQFIKNVYESIRHGIFESTNHLIEGLNKNPHFFPVKGNKVVNLKTGEVQDRTRFDFFTWESFVNYPFGVGLSAEEKDEVSKDLDALIKPIFCAKDDRIAYMRSILGSALTTTNLMRSFFIFLGEGSNGKSVLLDLMKKIMGPLFLQLPRRSVVSNRNSIKNETANSHTADTLGIDVARLIMVNELRENDELNSDFVKIIASNDYTNSRAPFADHVDLVRVIGKLFICSNHIPLYNAEDLAMKDRIKYCNFDARFYDPSEYKEGPNSYMRNRELSEKFEIKWNEELNFKKYEDENNWDLFKEYKSDLNNKWIDAFFNFLVEGCRDYLAQKYVIPDDFNTYKREINQNIDYFSTFLSEKLGTAKGCSSKVSEVYSKYSEWSSSINEKPMSYINFSRIMSKRGYKSIKIHGVMCYENVKI